MALIWVLSIILIVVCAWLVFMILGQDVKGGGLAGALGGGSVQSAFGSKTTETLLKMTAYLTVGFFVVVIVLIILYGRGSSTEGLTGSAPVPGPVAPVESPEVP